MPRRTLTHDTLANITAAKTTDEIIAAMKEEDELVEYRNALARMNPNTREVCNEIRGLLRTENQTILDTRYRLGELLLQLYNDETDNGAKVYGRRAIQKICKVLDLDDDLVRSCKKFAQTFTREQFTELRAKTLPRGEPLSWSHIRTLLQVEDHDHRTGLLQKTVEDGLRCNELAYEADQLLKKRPDDHRGRPPKEPSNYDQAIRQLTEVAEHWERRYEKVWNQVPHSLLTKVAELSPDEMTTQRLNATRWLAHQLRTMAEQVNVLAEKADKAACSLEKSMHGQSKQAQWEAA